MFIKASDRRHLRMSGIAFQTLGVIVIIWGFLIPAPLSIQILISLAVTFVIVVTEHIQSAMAFSRTEAGASSWIDTLTFRLAINKAIFNAQRGEYAIIDWEKVTQEAFEDVKRAQDDDKIYEELSSSKIDWLITVLAIPTVQVIYPLIGYGVALLVKMLVPGITEGM